MIIQIGRQLGNIDGLALLAAGAVQLEGQPGVAHRAEEVHGQHHHLNVGRGVFFAQYLGVELAVLPQPPGLGALAAEAGTDGVELHRLRPTAHAVLDVGAHEAGGELRPQSDAGAIVFFDGVHLFLHKKVGAFARTADEQVGGLQDRRVDTLEAVTPGQFFGRGDDHVPIAALVGQHVVHTRETLNLSRQVVLHRGQTREKRPVGDIWRSIIPGMEGLGK